MESQEIRHALYQGIASTFIHELSKLKEFKQATEKKISSKRMLDREFVNRFVAFFITPPRDYAPDLQSFLNTSMEMLELMTIEERDLIKESFKKSMFTSRNIFGNWAFRKADEYPSRRKPINKSIFEIWAIGLANLSDKERQTLINRRKKVLHLFSNLCKSDQSFISSVSQATGDKTRVVKRFLSVENLIKEVLND